MLLFHEHGVVLTTNWTVLCTRGFQSVWNNYTWKNYSL